MSELVEFIRGCLDADEQTARAAFYEGQRWVPEEEAVVAGDRDLEPVLYLHRKRDAEHAANWSPARVLAEVNAKRAILDLAAEQFAAADAKADDQVTRSFNAGAAFAMHNTLLALAQPFQGEPGWRDEWGTQ